MNVGCKPSLPCCHPRPTCEGYTGVPSGFLLGIFFRGGQNLLLCKFLLLFYCFWTKFQEGAKVFRGQTASGGPLPPCVRKPAVMRIMPNHHLVMRPFLHRMTMHHLWVANFLTFLSWKEVYACGIYRWRRRLGNAIQSTDELLNRGENVFCHSSNINICKQAEIFRQHLPS